MTSTRNNFPEGGLSLEGVARGDNSSILSILLRGSYSWWKPHRGSYLFYYTEKYKPQKWKKLQTPDILDKYSSSPLLN